VRNISIFVSDFPYDVYDGTQLEKVQDDLRRLHGQYRVSNEVLEDLEENVCIIVEDDLEKLRDHFKRSSTKVLDSQVREAIGFLENFLSKAQKDEKDLFEPKTKLEEKDIETLKEELGDLSLHILFQAELARESGKFDISDSLRHISEKLIHRHTQVFGKKNNKHSANEINKSWEIAKQKEKQRDNVLDGVPKNLPALIRARRIQEKAANVGFDWDELPPVLDKVDEEMTELKEAVELKDPENIKDEMGDVLFSLVNLSRFLDINPEDALRKTISKFETRFSQVEKELKKRGKSLTDSTLEEMDEIWNLIKKKARA